MTIENPSINNKQQVQLLVQSQRFEDAQVMCREVCKHNPRDAEAWFLLGAISGQLGDFEEAETCCHRAIKLQPNHAGLHYNLAIALAQQDKLDEAVTSFRQAIRLNPQYAQAYLDLGNTLQSLGKIDKAISNYQQAIRLQPTSLVAHNNLGDVYRCQDRLDDAEACYTHALEIKPDFAQACSGLANIYISRAQYTEAVKLLEPVIGQLSDNAELYIKLGFELMLQGEHEQSLACLQKILSLKPDHVEARWAFTMLQIPAIYGTDCTPAACRSKFSRELANLENWFREKKFDQTNLAVGNQQPFFLAYQEENNRDLLSQYGTLFSLLMEDWSIKQGFSSPTIVTRDIIRIGIVSPHLLDHSVWDAIVKGWFQHLDQSRFELHTFHICGTEDEETALARSRSVFFTQGDKELHQWVEMVLNQQLDILIYPEIGLDAMTGKLASLRLAPVQVVTWGHPETTGLPTIDYYLSAEDFEPAKAKDYYTEQLVPLPHLGCYYHPLPIVPNEPDLKKLSINQASPILLCPGMPFKYAPQHDWIFVEIARELGQCQFIFFQHHKLGNLPAKLRKRLELVFTQANLEFDDYFKFIPWQKKPEFYGLMKHATVFMDTIGFSGFNTAMQAVECGLPIVTRDGTFMRGRLASGILRRMKIIELITKNEKEYVSLVVKIVRDVEYRRYLHQLIKTNRHTLFDDLAPIRAMEDFFTEVVMRRESP